MAESNFSFVKKEILRKNLDDAFEHILTLLPFTESITYNETAKSAFRKTVIIHTASVVEALLFHVLDNEFSDEEVADFYSSWELKEKKVLYHIDDSHEIVAGDYKKVLSKNGKEKMSLAHISAFLKAKEIIGKDLVKKIDDIRKIRNEQHIGPHKKVNTYSKKDLENAFSVAREVKDFVKNKYTA